MRRRFETKLAQHYPSLKVSVGSAELVAGQGIKFHNISIVEPGAEGPRAELANVEEMFILCQSDVKELIFSDPIVTHVTIRRPTIRVTRRLDGTWSAARLFPPPRFDNQSPEVSIENGAIEIFDPLKPRSSTLILRDLNMTASPAALSPSDPGGAPKRNVHGMLASDNIRRVEFHGTIDAANSVFSLSGEVEGLQVSPDLNESLPGPIADKLAAFRELRAEGQMNFSLAYDSKSDVPLRFQVAGQLTGGRIDDQRLPHPLTDIKIKKFTADNGGVVIDTLTASCNQATLKMSLRHTGFDANNPMWLQAKVEQLELDRQLLGVLPEALQEQWQKYRPIGVIDADLTLEFDGRTWRPETSEVSISFSNMSFTHYKFPYRVDRGKGSLELKNDLLTLDVTAYSGSQPVRMKAKVNRPLNGPTGCFEAKGDDIQLDKEIIKALPEKPQEVAQSLDPRGTINFEYRCWRDVADQPMHHYLRLDPNGCSIRYSKFPYQINNIRGLLEMRDHFWTFRNLTGMNESAKISGEGDLTPSLMGNKFILNLAANNVPLDQELHNALAPNIYQAWNDLQPQGMVDLTAQISYLSEQKQLSLGVSVAPKGEMTSIEPVHFPYRMDKLQGALLYQDGKVTLQQIKAKHGQVTISTEGSCNFLPDGGWNMHFGGLRIGPIDRDLILALPERLKKAVLTINPTGRIDLCGNLDLIHSGIQGEPLQSQWDSLQIDTLQGAMQCGVKLENICGSAILSGVFDGRNFFCRGNLILDSLNYKDHQFTNVTGPIWIDDQRVLLGSLVDKASDGSPLPNADGTPRTPRSISADLFGGKISGDGQVSLGAEPVYHLNAVLTHADLARMALEIIDGKQRLQGNVWAKINLDGVGTNRNALSGRGALALSDADIYELPVMISLLKILSIRAPDRNAFSTASMDYHIEGEHIYLDRIDFNGDAISLQGSGEMDFQSNVKLNFSTRVGRGELDLPVIKQVFRGASEQILQIYVGGSLQNPDIRKEAFPAVNQALQHLQGARQQ
ncbi:MAG: AsmA-like C-terminal region-containing protein [Thermoguttaceae bacterium]